MSAARRHLHVVNDQIVDEDGELVTPDVASLVRQVEKLTIDLRMAQRDVKAKNRRIAEIERNLVRERLEYDRRGDVERIARYWWRKCRNSNPRVQYMSPDRFDLIRDLLEMEDIFMESLPGRTRPVKRREPHYCMEQFKAAIDGAHYDPYSKPRKNGTVVRYDDISTIFKSAASMDAHIAKAPARKVKSCPSCGCVADGHVALPDVARDEVLAALKPA